MICRTVIGYDRIGVKDDNRDLVGARKFGTGAKGELAHTQYRN